jgi:hypothetical protein
LLQLDPQFDRKGPNAELNKKLVGFLSEFGITVEHLETLKDRVGVDAVGAADILHKVILIAKGQEDVTTLPEEAAHFAIELLGDDHPLVQRMLDVVVGTEIYNKVKRDYAGVYKGDETKIRKEAAGKMLADAIINKNEDAVPKLDDAVEDVFGEVAEKIFKKELSDFSTANLDRDAVFLQKNKNKSARTIETFKKALEDQIGVSKKRLAIFKESGRESFLDKERKLLEDLEKSYEDGKNLKGIMTFLEHAHKEMLLVLGDETAEIEEERIGRLALLKQKYEDPDSVNLNEAAGTLKRMRNLFGAYAPILEDLKAEIDDRVREEGPKKAFLGIKSVIDELTLGIQEVENNYYDLGIPIVAKALGEFAGNRGVDKDGNPIELDIEGALRIAQKDVSILSRWLDPLAETDDPILMLIDKMVKYSKQSARLEVNNIRQDLLQSLQELEAAGITTQDWMYERDEDGKLTGDLISSINHAKYRKARNEFFDKIGPRPEEKAAAKIWGRKVREWMKIHTEPRPDVEAIKAEMQKRLGKFGYEKWLSDNTGMTYDGVTYYKGTLSQPNSTLYRNHAFANLSAEQLKFHKKIMDIKAKSDKLIPLKFVNERQAPQIRKDWLQRTKSGQGLFKTLKEGTVEATQRLVDDDEFGNKQGITDELGRPVNFLPVYYTRTLGKWVDKAGNTVHPGEAKTRDDVKFVSTVDKDLSTDIVDTMLLYTNMAHNFGAMDKIINVLDMSKDILYKREMTTNDADGNPVKDMFRNASGSLQDLTEPGAKSMAYQRLNDYYNMVVFGKFKAEEGKLFGTRLDQAKTLDTFGRYVAINNLAFNVFSGIANITFGGAMIRTESFAKEFVDNSNMLWADKTYGMELPSVLAEIGQRKTKSKLGLWMEMTDTLQDFDHQLRDVKTGRKTVVGQMFGTSSLYFINHAGEHMMQARMSLALADRIKLKDKDGNIMNLYDAYEIKGNNLQLRPGLVDAETGEAFKQDDLIRYINRTNFVNKRLHGIYNDIDKNVIQRYAVGRLAIMFRKFIVPGVNRRFEKLKYNEEGEAWVEGYYRTTGRFLAQLAKDIRKGQFLLASRWKELSETEVANLMRMMTEAGYMVASATMAHVLTNLSDDDDENWALAMAAYQANRLYTELRFYTSPTEGLRILKSPAAGVNTLQDMIQFLEFWTWNEEITRGRYSGMTKLHRNALKIIPTYKTIHKALSPEEELTFFK